MADEFIDLLEWLDQQQWHGLISRLSVGFYEGWRPGRGEVADLVAVELGVIDWEEQLHRTGQRKTGHPDLVDFTGQDFAEHRRHHILATPRPRRSEADRANQLQERLRQHWLASQAIGMLAAADATAVLQQQANTSGVPAHQAAPQLINQQPHRLPLPARTTPT